MINYQLSMISYQLSIINDYLPDNSYINNHLGDLTAKKNRKLFQTFGLVFIDHCLLIIDH